MLLAGLVWVVALLTAASFVARRWFPQAISAHAARFDSYFHVNLAVAGIVFLAAQFALGILIWRYRRRGQPARYSEGDNRIELLWTAATGALFLAAAIASARMWVDVHMAQPQPGDLRIELAGKQFAWNVRYAGPDGRFGRTDPRLMNDAAGNPLGIDEKDPAGKDDIVGSVLRIPAGRPIVLLLHSHDVIHNFFVRELRIKQDLVPGMEIPLRIQADRPGEYEIACAELCGLGHHQMRSVLIVMPPAEFDQWMRTPRSWGEPAR